MSERKLPPALAKKLSTPKRKVESKAAPAKKRKLDGGPKKKLKASHKSASSDSSRGSRTYALYSNRRHRTITRFEERDGTQVTLAPAKPYFPRMDGGGFKDYNKGELLYLVAKEDDGTEKRIAKLDLALYNIREDVPWNANIVEENLWADEGDYEPEVDSLPEFLKKVDGDNVTFEEGNWKIHLSVDRATLSVFMKKVTIELPNHS